FPETKILRYPAVAEEDEKNRHKGEALFPEHKSLPFLMERRKAMSQASWESEYQQNPILAGGGMFPIEKFQMCPHSILVRSSAPFAIGTKRARRTAARTPPER